MNTTLQTSPASMAGASACPMRSPEHREGPILSPLILALAMSLRVAAAFGLESARRIAAHLRAQITWQTAEAARVAAIDDDLEREFPLFLELLANDPPKKRARALAILRATMANTAARSRELDPQCPPHLLTDR